MKELPLSEVYQLLEPGPVVLLTTAHGGKSNVMTMSWHMMVEFEPVSYTHLDVYKRQVHA